MNSIEQIITEKSQRDQHQDRSQDTRMFSERMDQLNARPALLFGKRVNHWILFIANSLSNLIGVSSATLLGRLYFVHGGSHRWIYTWIQSVGWPILLVPLLFCYWRQSDRPSPPCLKLIGIYTLMGCVTAFDNLMYAWGLSYLPVSTNSILCSSQLVCNAIFAFTLLRHKITSYVLNSIVIITMGAVLLGIHANSDRPVGVTQKQYVIGFIMTIAASSLYALTLTLMELIYRRIIRKNSFFVVLETQTFISAAATVFSMIAMWISGDFDAMRQEASDFDLGSSVYSLTLVLCAVGWQLCFLGSAGMIFLTSSLMSCVFITATLPLISIMGVIVFHDNFSSAKIIAMLLSIWGFLSYIYGSYLASKSLVDYEQEETQYSRQTMRTELSSNVGLLGEANKTRPTSVNCT